MDKYKLCTKELTNSLDIDCKDIFCFNHLIQNRQNDIEKLIEKHCDINQNSFSQLNINQHLQFIDKWEYETVQSIHKHIKYVKEKILAMFKLCKSHLKEYHTIIGKELKDKKDVKIFNECEHEQLSQRIEQLDKDIQYLNKMLHQISINELNQIVNKYNQSTNTIGIESHFISTDKSLKWNYLHEIKLDSTYGYMAANNQQIFLGWKNRIVIYNLDGTKHDETRLQSTELYGELCDIIWSSIMQCFFILCRKSLFVHYPSSSQIEILSKISLVNQNNQYISLTTYKHNLYLLSEKSLELWKLNNDVLLLNFAISISFLIENPSHENICCIRGNDQYLSLLIQNAQSQTWRLDTYNYSPFYRLHMGISFDYFNQPYLGVIMPFHNNIYLFMNWETKLMRIIDKNGSNQIIDYNAYNACLLGSQRRIVVNYMKHLKIYEY